MEYRITVRNTSFYAREGENLLEVLRQHGLAPDAPCGGNGKCGKCGVKVNGAELLSCKHYIHADMRVLLPSRQAEKVLTGGIFAPTPINPVKSGYLVAFDVGTTTVVCFLLSPSGKELAVESMLNPQVSFGADVISRIQSARNGSANSLSNAIRSGMMELIKKSCIKADISPKEIGVVSVVGNPCMQQLLMGIPVDNLATVPFTPVITKAAVISAKEVLPICQNAAYLVAPDVSGYIGADTAGCVLAARLYEAEDTILLIDIGTNGEMVLSHKGRMVACSTAAGPALEGANIKFGMRGSTGAIDHITGSGYTTIGDVEPIGICGSGLIDAVAVMLDKGLLNRRGRVQTADRNYYITDTIYLTQEDIRQVQMAKGAIAAGIYLMSRYLGIEVDDIDRIILAGAFGNYLNPKSACRIGLLPPQLEGKVVSAGNLAGSGARLLAMDSTQLVMLQKLVEQIEFLELASISTFQKTFAKEMTFEENV